MRRMILWSCVILMFITGCQFSPTTAPKKITLRITNLTKERNVTQLLQTYQFLHPEVEFDFRHTLNMNLEKNRKTLEQEMRNSDIVITSPFTFEYLVETNQLQPLDSKMKKDWKWENYEPFLKKALQKAGGQEAIYGVAPTFESLTFVCDVDKFKEAGMSIPKERLTWDEFMKLSEKLAIKTKKPVVRTPVYQGEADFLFLYARYLNLKMFNPRTKKIELNNEGWKKAWEMTRRAMKSKILLSSDVAVHAECPIELVAPNAMGKHFEAIPMPKLNETSAINPMISLGCLYGISKSSEHAEEAWKVLQHIMKDSGLSKNTSYAKTFKHTRDRHESKPVAFTQGEVAGISDYLYVDEGRYKDSDYGFSVARKFKDITSDLIQEVAHKNKPIKEALLAWQKEGEKAVIKLKEGEK